MDPYASHQQPFHKHCIVPIVACVYKTGGDYTAEYVERLYRDIMKYSTRKIDFVVYTDSLEDLPGRTVVLKDNLPGWWSKLELFYEFTGRTIYFDLDTVIVGSLEKLYDYDGPMALIRDFYDPDTLSTGVMAWNSPMPFMTPTEDQKESFSARPPGIHTTPDQMDQYYIVNKLNEKKWSVDVIQDYIPLISYKADCRDGIPDGTSIICFHGRPRPHEVNWLESELTIDTVENDAVNNINLKTRDDLADIFSGKGMELGVAAGEYSARILKNDKVDVLYSIDRWTDHHNLKEYMGVLDILSFHGSRSRVIRASFDDAIDDFGDGTMDFIYIDGYAHTGQEGGKTLADWWPKVRSGGILSGHDYHPAWPLTMKTVNEFATANGLIIGTTSDDEYPSWFIIKEKKRDGTGLSNEDKYIDQQRKQNIKFSILCPTRDRVDGAKRLRDSVLSTCSDPASVEILFYVDSDDRCIDRYKEELGDMVTVGEPISVSKSWNIIAEKCNGSILMMANDDQVYRTSHWDLRISEEVGKFPDEIYCMWTQDGINGEKHCAFPIVSRKWYETLGYFTPGVFEFMFNDTWIMDIGKRVGRLHYVEDVLLEHLHFAVDKADFDDTYNHGRKDNKTVRDKKTFDDLSAMREEHACKIRMVMSKSWHAHKIYDDPAFFENSDGAVHIKKGMLKYGDAICAIAYSFGIESFDKVSDIFGLEKFGNNRGMLPLPEIPASLQIAGLLQNANRKPKHVLEVGSGRGEVSVALTAFAGIKVTAIEPAASFIKNISETENLFNTKVPDGLLDIRNVDVRTFSESFDVDDFDTVIMVESLEHILEEDFNMFYAPMVEKLKKNRGRLIIVNWPHYHPIAVGQYAPKDQHCRRTDDKLYNLFEEDAHKKIYRFGSHLVLDY